MPSMHRTYIYIRAKHFTPGLDMYLRENTPLLLSCCRCRSWFCGLTQNNHHAVRTMTIHWCGYSIEILTAEASSEHDAIICCLFCVVLGSDQPRQTKHLCTGSVRRCNQHLQEQNRNAQNISGTNSFLLTFFSC